MFKRIKKLLPLLIAIFPLMSVAATDLADKPILTGNSVQGNVTLALSVEFPTALGSSYTGSYNNAIDYIGYFDHKKCYGYNAHATDSEQRYFVPLGLASNHQCTNSWSGNFLNYALTQTIDPLRKALTGGHRSVDTASLTVLEKAFASGQGGTVNTPSIGSNANKYTPFSWSSVNVRINGLGKKFRITKSGNLSTAGTEIGTAANPTAPSNPSSNNNVYEFYARVQVCVAGMLEDNCTQYGANYKSTGLIQKNSKKLNFAAFGYLNDPGVNPPMSNVDHDRNRRIDGGVLRAKMAPLGPLVANPGSVDTINPNPEWDANTGVFITNPDPVAASATGVSNSGVINYLNKFGLTSSSYKRYDPVSELYYTAIRYLKNQGNVTEYSSMAEYSAAEKLILIDGFPVINTWNDPIQYSCQANFIIGVGDTNSHVDGNLPGSTTPGVPSAAMPATVSGDTTVNAKTATNRVGALQGIGTIGGYWSGNNNTRLMSGLAFDSHTVDMRPDLVGKQTVSTYWLDVLESGFVANNQYFLATKFGGFDVPTGFDPYLGPTTALATSTWDKNGDGDPDNYFRANNPAAMMTGLDKAFADILSKISGSSNTFAVANPSVLTGAMSFATSYKADTWTGNVIGNTVTFSAGSPIETVAWNADEKLDTQTAGNGWDVNRRIATSTCTAESSGMQTCSGTPFRPANVDLSKFSATPADQANVVNFIRGDASNTGALGAANLRVRTHVLGDIVNSKVVAVGPPRSTYSDSFNPGYSAFVTANAGRNTVAYVGANDGMLHAFNGVPTGGGELFAYIPNAVIKGPTNAPLDDGIATLANPSYSHKFFVDSTPYIKDAYFGGNWHSLLVGGLGKGGKAYYALDVTDPASMSSEANVASKVLWEFTHQDLGYTYGRPLVVKTKKYGWTVIFTSGYNNADGKGYFFLVNPQTGALLEKISTNEGSTANDAGLAHLTAFVADQRSFETDAVYAGDLLGNVWRLDVSGAGVIPAPTKIAAFGATQPITVSPVVEVEKSTLKRYVFVGTGRLLADSYVNNTQQQTFYAILDGTQSQPFTATTLPASASYPVTKSQMVNNTNTTTTGGVVADAAKPMGYYVDLGNSALGSPYRINIDMVSSAGVVVFAANSVGGDACSPTGSNNMYAFTYGTGQSVLVDSSNAIISKARGDGLATSISFFRQQGTTGTRVNISNDLGESTNVKLSPPGVLGFKQLNWRELPTSD